MSYKIPDACTGRCRGRDFSGEHLTPASYKTFTFYNGEITFCTRNANCYPEKYLHLCLSDSWRLEGLAEGRMHNA
ncbi:MAG TPA: hypothetical protein ENN55_00035 [Firmicutes bacterium]|nr:hypothetical protein [Bacillota bacterium]